MPDLIDLETLTRRLRALPARRQLVAIAGAPGSGKSTLAEGLAAALADRAAVVPMDGFHYDDRVLQEMGLLSRKGAPETFDVGGLAAMLDRLAANNEPWVTVPVFDREIEIARAGARRVAREVDLILVEGNYLLLDRADWAALAPCFTHSVMIDVPEEMLRARLVARWQGQGLPPGSVRSRVEGNDLVNAATVRRESRPADWVLVGDA